MEETRLMPIDLPQTDEAKKKKEKVFQNEIWRQLNRLMNYTKCEAADIHRATGVPFSTLSGWVNGKTDTQLLDDNVKKVASYFGTSVDFLAFSTPVTERDIELEDLMPDILGGDDA